MKIDRKTIILAVVLALTMSCAKQDMSDVAHLGKAREYLQQNKHRAAIIELKNALQKNPANKEARLLLGKEYLLQGNGASAEKELRRAGELGAGDQIKALLAQALLQQGKYQAVIDEFSSAAQAQGEPADAALLVVMGDAALKMGQAGQAASFYRRAEKLAPGTHGVLLAMARLMVHEGEHDKAASYLEQAMEAAPQSLDVWNLKGLMAFGEGRYEEALASFSRARDLAGALPFSPEAFKSYAGVIQAELALRRHDTARKDIEALVKRLPRHPLPRYYRALLAFQEGDFDAAHDDLQEIMGRDEVSLPAILLFGAVNYAKGNYAQAVMHLERFLDKMPGHLPARKMLAAAYLHQQLPDKAESVLLSAVKDAGDDAELLSLVGQAAIQGGDLKKGERYLKRAIQASPKNPALREDLARFYMSSGQNEQAIAELEGLGGSEDLRSKVMLIVAHLRNKDIEQATRLARELVAATPDNPHLHYLLGRVLLLSGDRAAAREQFLAAVKIEPGLATANLSLADLAMVDGQQDQAEAYLQQILRHDDDNIQAMLAMARLKFARQQEGAALEWVAKAKRAQGADPRPYLMLADYYLGKGQAEKALQEIADVPDQFADAPAVLALAGKAQFRAGRLREALATYQGLVKRLPGQPGILFELAGIQRAMQDYAAADESLSRALAAAPDFLQARAARVELALQMGEGKKALALARELKKQYPASPLGLVLEGDVHMQGKAYREAQKSYRQAMRLQPAGIIAVKLARAYRLAHDERGAIKVLESWLDTEPTDTRARTLLATLYQQGGQPAKAEAHYRVLIEQQPDNFVALNNLAFLSIKSDLPQARRYAEKAHALIPGNASVTDTLGWILVKEGQELARGIGLLREARRQAPTVAEIQYHLAVGLAAKGEKDEARSLLQALLADEREFDGREDARRLLATLK